MIALRQATHPDDCTYFFKLRTDPVASRMSRRRAPTWDEHVEWWSRTTDHCFVAYMENGPQVGTIRLAQDGVVSIIVDQASRGLGYGPAMLQALGPLAKAAGFSVLLAEIAYENERSQKAFAKAGWVPILFERHI
jgi:L-amino acid N-acyltransferase YncA